MAGEEISYRLLDGPAAAEDSGDLLALYQEVYKAEADPGQGNRARVWSRQPGFVLAEARHGGYLIGYATGLPLRPSTDWWRRLTAPLPPAVTEEHQGRTFALTELLVRASWRRQGIARELHDLILTKRTEERATLTVSPTATAAQAAFRSLGWKKLARTRAQHPQDSVLDILVTDLPYAPVHKDPWDW
jgi:ribosomal protein S18 acetylase RimI-like enzyme